jgi:hypothetical protein
MFIIIIDSYSCCLTIRSVLRSGSLCCTRELVTNTHQDRWTECPSHVAAAGWQRSGRTRCDDCPPTRRCSQVAQGSHATLRHKHTDRSPQPFHGHLEKYHSSGVTPGSCPHAVSLSDQPCLGHWLCVSTSTPCEKPSPLKAERYGRVHLPDKPIPAGRLARLAAQSDTMSRAGIDR